MAHFHARTVILLVLSLLLPISAIAAPPPAFPLSAGTVWTYRGLIKWTASPNTVHRRTISWTMTITRTLHYRQYDIAVIKGHPLDLAWYDATTKPGDYLIVFDGAGKYYLLSTPSCEELLARVQTANGDLADLLTPADLFLDLPLANGKTFALDPQLPARTDHWYCWSVEGVHKQTLPGVHGIAPTPPHAIYQLAFRTNPDEQVVDFVPTIGLSAFTYRHHGTVAETHLKLVAFHSPCPIADKHKS